MRLRHCRLGEGRARILSRAALCLALASIVGNPPGWADDPGAADALTPPASENADSVIGFTSPIRMVTLAALQPGRIGELPADEGQRIEAGEPAIHLEDSVQRRRLELAEAAANSTLEVDLARLRLEHAKRELERIEGLSSVSSVSAKELSDARTAAAATELELAQAEFKHDQAQRELDLQRAMFEQMHVCAPFSGYVAARLKQEGDSVEDREGVLTLVQLDPLVVAIDCPLEFAARVARGRSVAVEPIDGGGSARGGEVFFVSRVADPASQTFKVKIRVANADASWMAGMRVNIRLDQDSAVAAEPAASQVLGK